MESKLYNLFQLTPNPPQNVSTSRLSAPLSDKSPSALAVGLFCCTNLKLSLMVVAARQRLVSLAHEGL